MEYVTITQDEQDDTIVGFYMAQERDHDSHTSNKQRYETMLVTLPEGAFRTRIEGLLADTIERLVEVDAILSATVSQLPTPERIEAAKTRLLTKTITG